MFNYADDIAYADDLPYMGERTATEITGGFAAPRITGEVG